LANPWQSPEAPEGEGHSLTIPDNSSNRFSLASDRGNAPPLNNSEYNQTTDEEYIRRGRLNLSTPGGPRQRNPSETKEIYVQKIKKGRPVYPQN
jgi:hypothetical protein